MSASKEKKDKVAGLFEFADEKKVGVAYLSQINDTFWQKSDKNVESLTEIIEKKTVLRVSWPSDKDKSPKTVPAILLKTGKWEVMCEYRDNVDKYDTLEPSKEDRRAFSDLRKRKSAENTAQTTKKGKNNSKEDLKKKEASIRVSQGRLMSRMNREDNKRKRIEVDTSSADDSIKSHSINKRKKKNSTEDSELYKRLSKLISEEYSSIKKTVNESMNIIASKVTTIEKEIPLLRFQLSAVSSSLGSLLGILSSGHQSTGIGLPTARKIFNSPLNQSENTCKSSPLLSNSLLDIMKMDLMNTLDTSTADFPPDIPSASQVIDKLSESPPVQVLQSVSKPIAMDQGEDSNVNSKRDEHGGSMIKAGKPVENSSAYNVSKEPTDQVAASDIDVQNGNNSTVDVEPIKSIPPVNDRPSKSKEAAASSTLKEQPSKVPSVQNDSNEGLFENFGGVLINQNKLSLCDRHGKLSKFINDVMLLIFSRQEMADSSISGKRSNVHAHRGVNEVREKKQLDIVKVKALIEYIKKEIPGSEEKKIVEAIRSKLKYEGTRVHGVGFRKPDDNEYRNSSL